MYTVKNGLVFVHPIGIRFNYAVPILTIASCAHLFTHFSRYTAATSLRSGFVVGESDDIIWLSRVRCTRREHRLHDCPSTQNHQCDHSQDAGVRCAGTTCTQGAMRLSSTTSGLVQICNQNAWGSVCSADGWTDTEAKVVCRELRLPSSSMYYFREGFGFLCTYIYDCMSVPVRC